MACTSAFKQEAEKGASFLSYKEKKDQILLLKEPFLNCNVGVNIGAIFLITAFSQNIIHSYYTPRTTDHTQINGQMHNLFAALPCASNTAACGQQQHALTHKTSAMWALGCLSVPFCPHPALHGVSVAGTTWRGGITWGLLPLSRGKSNPHWSVYSRCRAVASQNFYMIIMNNLWLG